MSSAPGQRGHGQQVEPARPAQHGHGGEQRRPPSGRSAPAAGRGTGPRARTASPGRAGSRPCATRRRAAPSGPSSSSTQPVSATERASPAAVGAAARRRGPGRAGRAGGSRAAAASRARTWCASARPSIRPRADRMARQHQPPDQHGGHQRVVGVALQRVRRERERRPGQGQPHAQPQPGQPPAQHQQPADAEDVEEGRGAVGGGKASPRCRARAAASLERDVGEVVERAVGVAASRSRRGRCRRACAPCAMRSAPITPGVAHVDDVGVEGVEAEAQRQRRRPAGSPAARSGAEPPKSGRRRAGGRRLGARRGRSAGGRRAAARARRTRDPGQAQREVDHAAGTAAAPR